MIDWFGFLFVICAVELLAIFIGFIWATTKEKKYEEKDFTNAEKHDIVDKKDVNNNDK